MKEVFLIFYFYLFSKTTYVLLSLTKLKNNNKESSSTVLPSVRSFLKLLDFLQKNNRDRHNVSFSKVHKYHRFLL